jgi:hypothetical protein
MNNFLKLVKAGNPISAEQWNRIVKTIEGIKFFDTPSIKWKKSPYGYSAISVGSGGGSGLFAHPYMVSDASDFSDPDNPDIKVIVGRGNRRVIGGQWIEDGGEVDCNKIIPNWTYTKGHIIIVYEYGVGFKAFNNSWIACKTSQEMIDEGLIEGTRYHIEHLADFDFDLQDNTIKNLWQRVTQDIQFYDIGGCSSPVIENETEPE